MCKHAPISKERRQLGDGAVTASRRKQPHAAMRRLIESSLAAPAEPFAETIAVLGLDRAGGSGVDGDSLATI